MLIKPLFDAYLKRFAENKVTAQFNALEFLRLPYQIRLYHAGARIKLTKEFRKTALTYLDSGDEFPCPIVPLFHFVTNVPSPDLENFVPCSWNDVHILAFDNTWLMLFPFEYQIILPDEKK